MPRGRRRVAGSDDDDFDMTQASTSSASRTQRSEFGSGLIDSEEVVIFANNVVKFILNNSITKLPFKRQDITKNFLNGNTKLFDSVFKLACEKLMDVYGIQVALVEDVKSVKQYLAYSNFPATSIAEFNEEQGHETALLFLILSYIFMKGSEITEHALFDFLDTIQICDNEVHPYFGDVAKYIKEVFPKQHYLRRTKMEIEGVNEERIVIKWGQRAHLEFDKKKILQTVGKIMNKSPQNFINQYSQAFGDEAMQEEPASQFINDS